jgi:hypothetical protein
MFSIFALPSEKGLLVINEEEFWKAAKHINNVREIGNDETKAILFRIPLAAQIDILFYIANSIQKTKVRAKRVPI